MNKQMVFLLPFLDYSYALYFYILQMLYKTNLKPMKAVHLCRDHNYSRKSGTEQNQLSCNGFFAYRYTLACDLK